MKTFNKCGIGDIIYKVNFNKNEILKYEIINIVDSPYNNQIRFILEEKKQYNYSYEFSNTLETRSIDVFKDKSYENERSIIGHYEYTFWCADKFVVNHIFYNNYRQPILNKLNELRQNIDSL